MTEDEKTRNEIIYTEALAVNRKRGIYTKLAKKHGVSRERIRSIVAKMDMERGIVRKEVEPQQYNSYLPNAECDAELRHKVDEKAQQLGITIAEAMRQAAKLWTQTPA